MTQLTPTIKTVVIPAAGKGTRMLPATQITAKELLPVYDRLVIQFAIDEAIEAGAERIIIVVSAAKPEIREFLGDTAIASTFSLARWAKACPEIVYVVQDEPKGLGHAILCCDGLTLPGPFAVILPDDIIMGQSCLPEMVEHFEGGHMIAAMKVPPQDTCQYGIFSLAGSTTGTCIPASGMVEKPPRGQAPSSLAAVGRYILQPMIFDTLARTLKGAGGEIQLTDAIVAATPSVPMTAFRFSGTRYDCGNHDGLLAAANARQSALVVGKVQESLSVTHPKFRVDANAAGKGTDQSGNMFRPSQQAS